MPVLLITPIVVAAYYTGRSLKSQKLESSKTAVSDSDYIPRNNWVYLEHPIIMPKSLPGDGDQISLDRPVGTVQDAMSQQKDPIAALGILATHEASKDRAIIGLWKEFFRPTREILTRSVDQPITNVNILKAGGPVDRSVTTGSRFWDAPVPRSTGIDRYYKRDQTVPWYLIP